LARRWAVVFEDVCFQVGHAQLAFSDASKILHTQSVSVIKPLGYAGGVYQSTNIVKVVPASKGKVSSLVLDDYIEEKQKSWSPKSRGSNERSTRLKIESFIQIVGDKQISTLVLEDVVEYKSVLLRLPANRSKIKQYRSLSISQLLEFDIPESKRLSIDTLMGHFSKVSAFLDWCACNNLAKENLKQPLQRVLRKPKTIDQQRDSFSKKDLKKLFQSTRYMQGLHQKPSHYFVPLLGLYTGARQNELCQLYVRDVYQEEKTGIWVIDINEDAPDKRLKRFSHARLVPVHRDLIELGFLTYVKSLRGARVFPELKFKRDGYGQTFSRWFNEVYRSDKWCDVGNGEGESKNFHSFRHTFVTELSNVHDIPQHKVAHIVGHRPSDGSETIQRYTKATDLVERHRIINLLEWEGVCVEKVASFQLIKKINRS